MSIEELDEAADAIDALEEHEFVESVLVRRRDMVLGKLKDK